MTWISRLTLKFHITVPGCFKQNVTYLNGNTGDAVPMQQIEALIAISDKCIQSMEYECKSSPLRASDVDLVYWQDRHGLDGNNYFTGSNFGVHVCETDVVVFLLLWVSRIGWMTSRVQLVISVLLNMFWFD